MTDSDLLALQNSLNFDSTVEAIIKRSCIIDYGIIQKIVSDGVVEVSVAVSTTEQNMFCMTCVLANIASSSVTFKIKPNVGDRVLVVYPRVYDDTMFTVPDSDEDKVKIIVNKNARGYNMLSGIAILINQYKKASHKNVISIEDGNIDIKLAYSKDDDKNFLNIATTQDGDIILSNDKSNISLDKDGALSFSNENCDIVTDKDGYVSYSNKKDNSTKLEFTSTGSTIQDKNGCKIVTDNQFTTINGKLKIKI